MPQATIAAVMVSVAKRATLGVREFFMCESESWIAIGSHWGSPRLTFFLVSRNESPRELPVNDRRAQQN